MKYSFPAIVAVLFTRIHVISAGTDITNMVTPITASSNAGMRLVQEARALQQQNNQQNAQGDDANYDLEWMQDYSIKFMGCHNVAQWNDVSNEEEMSNVRIQTHRYVRFRLCPSDSCSAKKALGCTSSYGDYVVDMGTYVEAHVHSKKDELEERCQEYANNNCYCDENNGGNGNAQECFQNCYYEAGMYECLEGGEEDNSRFLERYASCNEYRNENMNKRNLEGNAAKYYVGPYCSDDGTKVVLGLFADNTCTTFADSDGGLSIFENMSGYSLPYSSDSVVDQNCHACEKGLDSYYQPEIRDVCADTYPVSGKCETKLKLSNHDVNENACSWIEGIRMTPIRSNGIIHAKYHGSYVAALFITIFATAFVGLFFYILYLKSKLDTKTTVTENSSKSRSADTPVVKKSRWVRMIGFFRARSFRRRNKSGMKNDRLL